MLKLEQLRDRVEDASPESKNRHTRCYIIALREHLQRLNEIGVEVVVNLKRKDKGLIKALLFQEQKYKVPNTSVIVKRNTKPPIDEDAALESGTGPKLTILYRI